jgi:Skp family chaperone for outer membrane proteins
MLVHILLLLALQPPTTLEVPTAIVNTTRLVAESTAGKAATAQLKALQSEKQKIVSDKQAEVQKLVDAKAAPTQLQKAQLELQRLTQDAQLALENLDRELQDEFNKKIRPLMAQIAEEEHIGIVFEYPQPMIVWTSSTVDITSKVIERLDAASREKM